MAGLASLFGIQPNPFTDFTQSHSGLLTGIGAGLLSGDLTNLAQTIPAGGQLDQQRVEKLKADTLASNQQNATLAYFAKKYPDLADKVQAGLPIGEAWKIATEREKPPSATDAPANIREWETFNKMDPDQQAAYLRMKRASPWLNAGDQFVQPDQANPSNAPVAAIPINNEQAAYDTAFGGGAGKAAIDRINQLPQALSKADNMLGTIDGVLNDPALDSSTGWLSWLQGVPGTDQYRFGQRALQLQGQAFLQAFESLKGAGQITEVEGTKATQAIGRLSTAQKPEDYRQALQELKTIISASKARAVTQAGSALPPGSSGGGYTILGVE